ncbi:hypothetical protein CYMTET_32655, partial [Cymbomonas tetramitiformis]
MELGGEKQAQRAEARQALSQDTALQAEVGAIVKRHCEAEEGGEERPPDGLHVGIRRNLGRFTRRRATFLATLPWVVSLDGQALCTMSVSVPPVVVPEGKKPEKYIMKAQDEMVDLSLAASPPALEADIGPENASWLLLPVTGGQLRQEMECVVQIQRLRVMQREGKGGADIGLAAWRECTVVGYNKDARRYKLRYVGSPHTITEDLTLTNHFVVPSLLPALKAPLLIMSADGQWTSGQAIEAPKQDASFRSKVSMESVWSSPFTRVRGSKWDTARKKLTTQHVDLNTFDYAPEVCSSVEFEVTRMMYLRATLGAYAMLYDPITGAAHKLMDCQNHVAHVSRRELERLWQRAVKRAEVEDEATSLMASMTPGSRASDSTERDNLDLRLFLKPSDGQRSNGVLASWNYLVVGGPGVGKTTLMAQVLVLYASTVNAPVPIYMPVAELAREIGEGNVRFEQGDLLEAFLEWKFAESSPYVYRMLRQAVLMHHTIVLLDGMDEAGSSRKQIETYALHTLLKSRHRVIITSRPGGFVLPSRDTHPALFDVAFQ